MMSLTKIEGFAGHAANATSETMNSTIFHNEVRRTACAAGVAGKFTFQPEQSARISRAWANGETVWMAAATLIWSWEGSQLPVDDDSDRAAIRAAWRARREI
jgi:hypothetical protein